ncbi:type I-U CRISPR-associated helicase/endonuclease Cas3 [Sphaerobacter sp.]|uniref:type I-G CRISPR-associated helicase/endonuclease Cas3g n=1 Tax=Sphaerobacter sp. TaxID=2099654 RepID=UPI001DF7947A|nr:type I-U CRISPR-associated helicase/endonuclease Cas3 [Sphaerobacter sp.]MBX5446395.1 type I-U CRISPR-associated helicase/endonuclease Cas3 [Sphaerobacter sp.]
MHASFANRFLALTGFAPMRWQSRLFERFVDTDLPDACDIPTGLGKTSVLVIWLLALVQQAENGEVHLPRRLFYIVNRRTVVDQATNTVERLRRRLVDPANYEWRDHAEILSAIARTLRGLSATEGPPIALSTLRGELADNEEWKADPARPAIVVGTIDMIGSRLLFSGYGDGRYGRAHHAGLIGQDALIVHDEAHLTPAFGDLLRAISQEQQRDGRRDGGADTPARPIRVIELSATSRGGAGGCFSLEPDDGADAIVRARLAAAKRLRLHPAPDDQVTAKIVECAKAHDDARCKVLIYVRSPEQAQRVDAALRKSLGEGSGERIALLTGTIRGYERDRLVEANSVYRALLSSDAPVERTVYLVSTSAGEVGIDLDADHIVCDLTTLDSLIQRLGRVNRRGGDGRCARVDVVGDASTRAKRSELETAIAATHSLLQQWNAHTAEEIDASPGHLRRLLGNVEPEVIVAAFSPRPKAAILTDILLDSWSLTSIETMPGRPEVTAFLHGLTQDPPETFVAWRKEVSALHKAGADESALDRWFRACRITARERLHDRTDRVKSALAGLLKSHRKTNDSIDFPVVLLDERGAARWSRLSDIVGKDFDLAYRTLVLPVQAGGLDRNGMLDAKAVMPPDGISLDVAEEEGAGGERRGRWLCRRSPDGNERYEHLLTGQVRDDIPAGLREHERIALKQPDEVEDEAETLDLILAETARQSALDNPETAGARQTLSVHTEAVATRIAVIAERLRLPDPIKAALVTAAEWHDRGKDRPVWQRYARNDRGTGPLAKSATYLHPRALGGYRHEFGSLLDAMADAELRSCPERDLVLHLIAAHHGWARPHFEPRAYDNTWTTAENDEAAAGVMRRFGRLQQRYGRWTLAWLESLLRCADAVASREAVESLNPLPADKVET